jgi:hypothetical protein
LRALALVLCLAAGTATASAPETSPRPLPRPDRVAGEVAAMVAVRPAEEVVAVRRNLVGLSPRPETRPENLRRRSIVRTVGIQLRPPGPVAGSICGLRSIRGERLKPIPGRVSACGIAEPVRVSSVAGLELSQAAIMDCPTAIALNAWAERGVKPAIGRLGGGPVGLRVAAHYSCRGRNGQKGAKISEHGKGRAVDISAIELANGQSLTVLQGWRSAQHAKKFRAMHQAACGPFGTVLGPSSDRFHQDHFHFDTARYRSGTYCR